MEPYTAPDHQAKTQRQAADGVVHALVSLRCTVAHRADTRDPQAQIAAAMKLSGTEALARSRKQKA